MCVCVSLCVCVSVCAFNLQTYVLLIHSSSVQLGTNIDTFITPQKCKIVSGYGAPSSVYKNYDGRVKYKLYI